MSDSRILIRNPQREELRLTPGRGHAQLPSLASAFRSYRGLIAVEVTERRRADREEERLDDKQQHHCRKNDTSFVHRFTSSR